MEWMATNLRSGAVGPTVPLDVHCACASARRVPLRLSSDGLALLRQHLLGKLPGDLPIMTYFCRHCKQVATLTAADLYLTDG
jgi:hypothetical protein